MYLSSDCNLSSAVFCPLAVFPVKATALGSFIFYALLHLRPLNLLLELHCEIAISEAVTGCRFQGFLFFGMIRNPQRNLHSTQTSEDCI